MEKRTSIITALILAGGTVLAAAVTVGPSLLGTSTQPSEVPIDDRDESKIDLPTSLGAYYRPTGWMGDGRQDTTYLSVEDVVVEIEGQTVPALKIVYRPGGPEGWAGIYWQHPENNWGAERGLNLQGAKRISFYARGEEGSEIAEFKSGGTRDPDLPNHDSFETSLGPLVLPVDWKRYEISLAGKDLSNVIGAFAWTSKAPSTKPRTIYLAELQIN